MHRGGFVHVLLLSGIVVSVALAGCTVIAPEPTGTSASPSPSESVDSDPDGGSQPIAVVTIAAVDVDGEHVTVAGLVTQVEETDGDCEFEFVSGVSGEIITASTTSVANVSSTSCGSTQIEIAQLAKGPWDITLHYASPETVVDSEPVHLEIP